MGPRLSVHVHITIEKSMLCNGQQPGSAVIDQGEFVAIN